MPDGSPSTPSTEPRGPIFIVGAMGSGTTLLRLMLDSHGRIAIPHETGFMRAYNAMRFIPFKWTGRGWAKRLGWTDEEFDAELASFFDRIFRRYADEHGKARWGEKTPLHTWHVGAMRRLFPDAQFIGMVRHPGASTLSNMRRFHHTVDHMARHWERYNREIVRQAMALPDQFILLRYEDMVLDTERTLRDLLGWLGEPWDADVLRHHEVQAEREQGRIEGKSRADDPIDPSRLHAWADRVEPEQRKVLQRRLGRLGDLLGYSITDPAALAPLNDPRTPLVTGAQIARRAEAYADLDLTRRRKVPIFEQVYSPRKVWLVRNKSGEPPAWSRDKQQQEPGGRSRLRQLAEPVSRRLPATAKRRLKRAAKR